MGWILVMMVLFPVVAFGGYAAYALEKSARQNRLVSGNPEAAKLLSRAQRALAGIEESKRVRELPGATSREVILHARELTTKVLPQLLARHGQLSARVRAYEPGGDADRRRAVEQLGRELAETERTLESLVGGLETLDAQLVASEPLTGDAALTRSRGLIERLQLLEESCRELEEEKKCLDP